MRRRYQANREAILAQQRIDLANRTEEEREADLAYGRAYAAAHAEEARRRAYDHYHSLTPEQKRARMDRSNELRRARRKGGGKH